MNEPFANPELNALRMELAERLGTVEAKLENLTTEIAALRRLLESKLPTTDN